MQSHINVWTDSITYLRGLLEIPELIVISLSETRLELRGSTLRLSDGVFRVFISSDYPIQEQLRTLCHEMIHIWQYVYKDLAAEEVKEWPDYLSRWWEQEAIEKTPELFEKLCCFLLKQLALEYS